MHKFIFTDTNLFEQYQPIANIDWLELAGCNSVTLLIPNVVVRELNDHKDGGTRGRLKRRAAAALNQLREYAERGIPTNIREGVDLDFHSQEPLIDFVAHHLDSKLNDDRLVASAIEFAVENQLGRETVLIATGDFGLELKIKSQSLLTVLHMPETWRLPDELDAEESKIKQLENEIRDLRSSVPKLSLTFETGDVFLDVTLQSPLELVEDKVQGELAQLRCKYPLLRVPPQRSSPLNVLSTLFETPEAIAEYNKDLATYYESVEGYHRAMLRYLNRERLSAQLTFLLHNEGSAPAEDIDIELYFPDGFSIFKANDHEEKPREPKPPLRPWERFQTTMALDMRWLDLDSGRATAVVRSLQSDVAVNSRLLDIKKTNSYEVRFRVTKLKHTVCEKLAIRIRFDSFSDAGSFGVNYRVLAANVPAPVVGALHVKVSKENGE